MKLKFHLITTLLLLLLYCVLSTFAAEEVSSVEYDNGAGELLPKDLAEEPSKVLLVLLVRNKAHILPMTLSYLEKLNYPKDHIALWIRSDHNTDASDEILKLWLDHTSQLYHSVDVEYNVTEQRYLNETTQFDWPLDRFRHVIQLKESALVYAQKIWADFIFYVDADVLLTEPETLNHLTRQRLPIVAPMLLSEGLYSNFWCGMTHDYYYQRTEEYKEIYNVNKKGTFQVPMVHTAVLINLNYQGSRYLTFDRERFIEQQRHDIEWTENIGKQCRLFDGPVDDIIVFAMSANCSQIPLFVNNELPFGYLLQPLETEDTIQQDFKQLVNIRVNIIHDIGDVPPVNDYLQKYVNYPLKHKLTLDHIYLINLARRPERRQKMDNLILELGLDVEYFAAVDGKEINPKELSKLNVKLLPGYEDPYHHRQMTMGEIGCFLSHYRIWEDIVKNGYKEVLVLEDDIRFEPYFRDNAERVLNQARKVVEYDLIYFGRKRLKDENEPWVAGTDNLVHVGYSYWTLAYVISLQGAKKLLAARPLDNLLPVDEFLPIMFNRHPNKTWSAVFPERNMIAFSAAPLLLYPTHYTGEDGYISDTEDSEITDGGEGRIIRGKEKDNIAQLKSDREQDFPVPPPPLPSKENRVDFGANVIKVEKNADKKQNEEL